MTNSRAQHQRVGTRAITDTIQIGRRPLRALIAITSLTLIGCESKLPSCDDVDVLSALKHSIIERLRSKEITGVPEFRREQVLALANQWIAGAKFVVQSKKGNDSIATLPTCKATVTIPLLPSIHQLREVSGFYAAQKDKARPDSRAMEFRFDVDYTIEPGDATGAKFLVKARGDGVPSSTDAQALLMQVLGMDETVRISFAAGDFVGKWAGTMSCDSKVVSDYPEQHPPTAWLSKYSEAIEFEVKSVFELPSIPLTDITPPQSAVWTLGLARPVLVPEIPYFVNLARVVDAKVDPHSINFLSSTHGAVVVNLHGEVNADKLVARGTAELGAGMLRSQKSCELSMKRHK